MARSDKWQKKLLDISKTHRAEGHTVKMGYNKPIIDNIPYFWDEKSKNVKKSNSVKKNDGESPMYVGPEVQTSAGPSKAKN